MTSRLTFTGLHPGAEVSAEDVARLIGRLSKIGSPRPLAFETWATSSGIQHFVGRASEDSGAVKLLLTTHLPGTVLARAKRPTAPDVSVRLTLSARSVPLAAKAELTALFSLYSTLASVRKGEALGIQVAVGSGRKPERTPRNLPDPAQSLLGALITGERPAPSDVQREVAVHRAEPRVEVTVRLGVVATVPARQRALLTQLLGALRHLETPGVRLGMVRENPAKWGSGAVAWSPLVLIGAHALPFLAWPLEGLKLPGRGAAHPRLLPPPATLSNEGAHFGATLVPGQRKPVRLSVEARSQHLVITGGTGSGKSTVLAHLCLDDIASGRPALLIDPKRQLVDHILGRAPKEAAGRIVIIDAADSQPVGLNPLDVGDRDPEIVVDGILSVFKEVFADGWGPRTEDLLHAGLLTLAHSGAARGTPHTLLDLPELISSDKFRRSVVGRVQNDPALAAFWATFEALSHSQRANIIAAPMNKLRKFVLRRNVAAVLGQAEPRLRLRDLFKENKVVLVPLNDALLGPGAAQLLGGLIVAEAWLATMERASEPNPSERPAAIYIDEVQRFLHLPTSIEDALATSRSFGVAWVMALQGRAQVSKSFALALELNARNKLSFAASPHDARELAREANTLQAEDFQALRPYEVYANLVSSGAPAGWFSVTTLPPSPPLGHEAFIRRANTEAFGATPPEPAPDPSLDALSPTLSNQRKRRT